MAADEDIFESTRVPITGASPVGVGDAAGAEPAPNAGTNFPFNRTVTCKVPAQEQDLWCWAAVGTGIANYHAGSTILRQCELVNQVFGGGDCCENGDSANCNQAGSLYTALTTTENLAEAIPGTMSLGAVKDEISHQMPVGARINWGDEIGHAVAIVGCRHAPNQITLIVSDPAYGDGLIVSWRQFNNSYQGVGTWSHAYRTKVKG
ncbi:MAG: hypothetical protein M3464_00480 [Chloroflexota bacterium]|nr:hypothetical protein [Chloroflexota bacterium]